MSVLTRPSSPDIRPGLPEGGSLDLFLERVRALAGVGCEWVPASMPLPRGRRAAEVKAAGRRAGHLLAPVSGGDAAGALEAAAALIGDQIEREVEIDALADEVLKAWDQIGFVQRLADALTPITDSQRLSESILDEAVRVLGARSATLRLRDEKGSESLCLAARAAGEAPDSEGREDGFEVPIVRARPAGEPEEMGVLRMVGPRRGESFSAAERDLARALAAQAGVLLHQCRIMEAARREARARREAEIARDVQASLLPHEEPRPAGLEVVGACVPGPAVGGDAYDYLVEEPAALGLMMASVSGSGIQAAVAMAGVRALLRAEAVRTDMPGAALRAANHLLARDLRPTGLYATAFLARYEDSHRRLRYSSAGHPPALLWRAAEGRFERLDLGGLALGIFDNAAYEQGELVLEPGDLVVLYSDGVVETRNPGGEAFALERLCQTVMRHRRERPRTVLYRLLEAVEAFRAGEPQRDDLTLMVLRAPRAGQ